MLDDGGREGESSCAAEMDYARSHVRRILDSLACEFIVISTVVIYAIIIFVDLSLAAAATSVEAEIERDDEEETENAWESSFHTLDQVFLTVFLLEILLRLFAFGFDFLYDIMNAVDAIVVVVSFVVVMLPREMSTQVKWLKLLHIIRLFRFAIIVNKLQRSREAAALRRKVASLPSARAGA